MVLIFARPVRQVVGRTVALSALPCPALPCLSVSLSINRSINQSIYCSRAQLGRARTWTAPSPSPSPSSCTPWAPFIATVILLSPTCLRMPAGTYWAFPVSYFSLFSFSNSTLFIPAFLFFNKAQLSCSALVSLFPSPPP